MSRCRDARVIGKPPEKHLDLCLLHTGWMTHLMEAKELPDPEDAGLLGPDAVVQIPDALANSTENSLHREQEFFHCLHDMAPDTVEKDCTAATSGCASAARMRCVNDFMRRRDHVEQMLILANLFAQIKARSPGA